MVSSVTLTGRVRASGEGERGSATRRAKTAACPAMEAISQRERPVTVIAGTMTRKADRAQAARDEYRVVGGMRPPGRKGRKEESCQ